MGKRVVKNYPSPRLMETIGATNQKPSEAIGELVANSFDARNEDEKLQIAIDTYNESVDKEDRAALFIVDTSISDNNSIYADDLFGGADDATNSTLFCLISEDGLVKGFNKDINGNYKKSLYSNSTVEVGTTMVNNALLFIDQNFVSNDED